MRQIRLEEETLSRDMAFTSGGCVLVLYKGSRIVREKNQQKITGGFAFRKEDFFYEGETLGLLDEKRFQFEMEEIQPEQLAIGIRYYTRGWDTFLQRFDVIETKAEVFFFSEKISLTVEFSPFVWQDTKLELTEEVRVKSSFTSIYGDEMFVRLPVGFSFVLQNRTSMDSVDTCYFAPAGDAVLEQSGKLMIGLLGTEYISTQKEMSISFLPNQPAYFPLGGQEEEETSYITSGKALYYSQHSSAPFFLPKEGGCYLHTELPGYVIEQESALPVFLPPSYEDKKGMAEYIEKEYLAFVRREHVENTLQMGMRLDVTDKIAAEIFHNSGLHSNLTEGATGIAVSRNGMLVMLKEEGISWVTIICTGASYPDIAFTKPTSKFMAAFLAKELCMVLCDKNQLQGLCNTPYVITTERLTRAKVGGYPYTDNLEELAGNTYLSEGEFLQAVTEKTREENVSPILINACDHFSVTVEGFTFFLGKHHWKEIGCVFLMKLNTRSSLLECLENPLMWSLSPEKTQIDSIKKTVEKVRKRGEELKDMWLLNLLSDKLWQGCIAFYVPVDAMNMPKELAFLGGNLKTDKMKALYVAFPAATGVNLEHVTEGTVSSPMTALIDYEDSEQQYYEDAREFGFKVQSLRVKIENQKITQFQAKVELLMNRLFGGKLSAIESSTGNNIVFEGHYQKEGEEGRYVFTLLEKLNYGISGCGISMLSVTEGSLFTNGKKARFLLGGRASLFPYGEMDVFSYDGISYQGLIVDMERVDGENQFGLSMESFSFDQEDAVVRANSLGACFPIVPTEILYVKGRTPLQAGFLSLKVSKDKPEVLEEWYGITLRIALGDMGSLASGYSLGLLLLVAWIPEREEKQRAEGDFTYEVPKFFTGIQLLSNGNAINFEIPLQGVLTLGFESIELHKGKKEGDKNSYYFRFRNFALQLLGFRFPQTNNDMYLIADETKTLGWYGAAGEELT